MKIRIRIVKSTDKIPGGLGDKLHGTMEEKHQQIADMHGVPLEQIEDQMKMGTKVEMEHTNDKEIAHEIAMEHLIEDPKYYTRLATIDEKLKKVDGGWAVYPKKGGKRLGTHKTKAKAKKQLAAIEISKAKNK